jgi:hypothetical protein
MAQWDYELADQQLTEAMKAYRAGTVGIGQ